MYAIRSYYDFVQPADDGGLAIGALARQRRVERDPETARRAPLLRITSYNVCYTKLLRPQNTSAIFNKGLALNQIKKYADAVTCFDALLQINPKDSQAFNNKGIAMAEMGDTQAANDRITSYNVCYTKLLRN